MLKIIAIVLTIFLLLIIIDLIITDIIYLILFSDHFLNMRLTGFFFKYGEHSKFVFLLASP